jgi:hypothetical protein
MKKSSFLIILVLLTSFSLSAQFETTSDSSSSSDTYKGPKSKPQAAPLSERINVGGGFDLRFGEITVIGLTPLIAYKVTDKFMLGTILTYRYFRDNRPGIQYSTSTYGVTPFARHTIFKGLFVHAEYEMLYGEYYYNDDARWLNSLLVGGGYGVPLGDKGFAGVYVLWNLTPDPLYPIYEQPVIRMSFGVGL